MAFTNTINSSYIDEEVHFKDGQQLISTTDLDGRITSANDNFCEIAGYTDVELIGENHNIVRHKDMPKAAFQDLWDKLKAHKPWMGLVKNRTKCGRYYWVNAFVTPLYENGVVVGYQSVRTKPSRKDVERAIKLYQSKNQSMGFTSKITTLLSHPITSFFAGALALHFFESIPFITFLLILVLFLTSYLHHISDRYLNKLSQVANHTFNSPLIAKSYSDLPGAYAHIETAIKFLESKSVTILGRISHSSDAISKSVESINVVTTDVAHGTIEQQTQIHQIATAMEEMVATVEEIARNTLDTSTSTEQASIFSDKCSESMEGTSASLECLAKNVEQSANSAEQLNQQAQSIESVITVIRSITDQTSLLALNAAIEAARAGEQGRGFAVVADEVRALAAKTTQSTVEIEQTITTIQKNISEWVLNMQQSREQAQSSVSEMTTNSSLVNQQKSLLSDILGQSIQVSSATEEQGLAAKEINRNIHEISNVATSNTEHTNELQKSICGLQSVTSEMVSLVRSFTA